MANFTGTLFNYNSIKDLNTAQHIQTQLLWMQQGGEQCSTTFKGPSYLQYLLAGVNPAENNNAYKIIYLISVILCRTCLSKMRLQRSTAIPSPCTSGKPKHRKKKRVALNGAKLEPKRQMKPRNERRSNMLLLWYEYINPIMVKIEKLITVLYDGAGYYNVKRKPTAIRQSYLYFQPMHYYAL